MMHFNENLMISYLCRAHGKKLFINLREKRKRLFNYDKSINDMSVLYLTSCIVSNLSCLANNFVLD